MIVHLRIQAAGLLLLACLAGCAAEKPIEVTSSFGPGIRFDGLGETWAWMPEDRRPAEAEEVGPPSLHAMIRGLVETEMRNHGYERSSESPDFWVDYVVVRKWKLDRYQGTGFSEFEQGSLVLDLIDPESRDLIWRGVASARIDEADPPAVREDRVDDAVRLLMARIPDPGERPATAGANP